MKRSSRTTVVSKAFKVVDADTRNDIKNRHLLALEADNFVENEFDIQADDEPEVH